jgi:hypothetical protein
MDDAPVPESRLWPTTGAIIVKSSICGYNLSPDRAVSDLIENRRFWLDRFTPLALYELSRSPILLGTACFVSGQMSQYEMAVTDIIILALHMYVPTFHIDAVCSTPKCLIQSTERAAAIGFAEPLGTEAQHRTLG